MCYHITVESSVESFKCRAAESLLDAAMAANVAISYGCRSGFCGSCKVYLNAGEIEYKNGPPAALSKSEQGRGYILCCQASPLSDLNITRPEKSNADIVETSILAARVIKLELLQSRVMQLLVKLSGNEVFHYSAGQWVDILALNGSGEAVAIANAEDGSNDLEFHIELNHASTFSAHVFNQLQPGDLLRIEGPFGGFARNNSANSIVLVADGNGITPLKSLLETLLRSPAVEVIHLFCGARSRADFYHQQFTDKLSGDSRFQLHEVSYEQAFAINNPDAAVCLATAVLQVLPDMSAYCAYIAGSVSVVSTVSAAFVAAGLNPACLYSSPPGIHSEDSRN